ncbi:MAG: glycosyltransferase family 4 protein [Desulfobulbales bacterium]|nr:glycosyltransferase family 4 protein [Desulfobulbales bacterium]
MVAGPLTVVQMLPELHVGGVERGTLELGKYLVEHGHRSLVISGGGRLVSQLESEGSEHILWSVGKKSPLTLRYIAKLRKLLLDRKVDILHLRSRMPAWVGYLAWKNLPEKSRPRCVTTFHGFYSVNRYSAVMAKGEKVIAVSQSVARHIIQEYGVPADCIALIYRGFDETQFDPAAVSSEDLQYWRDKWGLADAGKRVPVIMLPGRLTRLKGHDVFIRALKNIADLDWLAVCVGDVESNPGYRQELQQLLYDLQLQDRVRFVGYCDNMPAAYLIADIVVSATSITPEAFGRVAIEAQAMERPVIASALGGSRETVLPGKTGWLVEPGNTESLAGALRESLSIPDLADNYGREGRKWVLENFTTERMCKKTVSLYNEILP